MIILTVGLSALIILSSIYIRTVIKDVKLEEFACNGFNNHPNWLGFAYKSDYYCVLTKDRTIIDINKTETHEKCHILIKNSDDLKKHFCGGKNET
jgi:hypothetical protein